MKLVCTMRALGLIKALFISKMSYATNVWINKENLADLNHLWYHILKSIVGAELNIGHNIAEFILGIPPIHIQNAGKQCKTLPKINKQTSGP